MRRCTGTGLPDVVTGGEGAVTLVGIAFHQHVLKMRVDRQRVTGLHACTVRVWSGGLVPIGS
eukprot:1400291-Prymnesium_polylepis.2